MLEWQRSQLCVAPHIKREGERAPERAAERGADRGAERGSERGAERGTRAVSPAAIAAALNDTDSDSESDASEEPQPQRYVYFSQVCSVCMYVFLIDAYHLFKFNDCTSPSTLPRYEMVLHTSTCVLCLRVCSLCPYRSYDIGIT